MLLRQRRVTWLALSTCARTCSVKPPPKEIEGDVFDRQRCIVGFDQGLIEKQTCLVLGTGGIGQNVALTLARLGVKKIIMLDCDTCVAMPCQRGLLFCTALCLLLLRRGGVGDVVGCGDAAATTRPT